MRFIWFPTAPHGPMALKGVLLSMTTHAALLGAVTYGSGPHARLLHFSESKSPDMYYLPPPDREPGQRALEEHISFVELAPGGVDAAPVSRDGMRWRRPSRDPAPSDGGATGNEVAAPTSAPELDSEDSVYSVLALEESAVRLEGSAAPVYPPDMLARGVEGFVFTRYVIDTTGHADSASLQVLAASNSAFEQSVRAALPGMRFLAAQVRGRKVRQQVQQAFQFRLGDQVPALPSVPAEHTRANPPA